MRHGLWQIVPQGMTSVREEPVSLPHPPLVEPSYTEDLATARQLPRWRDPALPDGWILLSALAGVDRAVYGYRADFGPDDGLGSGLVIYGKYASYRGGWEWGSWRTTHDKLGVHETRLIAGRPALVRYSPLGPNHNPLGGAVVWIYDAATESEYRVSGKARSLRGPNIEALIAIAASLFANPPLLHYGTYDATGAVSEPGHYAFLTDPGDPTSVVATYEELRDGTATALLIHTRDAHGIPQTALYDAVEPGDLFEWRQADDCFVRYQVTEVQPNPTGTVPQKLLAVDWMTYAFAGCTGGAIATTTAATLDWAALPDLGGTSLTTPIVHGIYQIVPEGWSGARELVEVHRPPGSGSDPLYPSAGIKTTDPATARSFPYWREPALPAGWAFKSAQRGGYDVTSYGYCAAYVNANGYLALRICGDYAVGRRVSWEASWLAGGLNSGEQLQGVHETRIIAGRPAQVDYSPLGLHHHRISSIQAWIHDPATESQYFIHGFAPSLRGANVDALIAIARSLFEPPNAP